MNNSWKVYWWEDGKKKFKRFLQDKPTEAIAYAKELRRQGKEIEVVSARRAFRTTEAKRLEREPGMLWCPYCVKWRRFKIFSVRREHYISEAFLRCPVCTVSTNDYYVKKFNLEVRSTEEIILQEAGRIRKPKRNRDD